jgi:hydroxymethylpyrimidine pyrophosphatase-like HAD family hydrolase
VSPTLVATDLDRTLVYSRGALRAGAGAGGGGLPALVAVERREGADAAWMTARAAAAFAALSRFADVVPVTTRTPEQWRRIRLPGPPSPFAVTANGGILLVDGGIDREWSAAVAKRVLASAPLAEVWAHVTKVCRPEWTTRLRPVEGLFCYAVLDPGGVPDGFPAEAAAWARTRGWRLSRQGRKLYWVPEQLTKSAAVAEVARRTSPGRLLAAGDSLLDADLLEAADRGIVARHGELVAAGWRRPAVVVTAHYGVRAGAEIVDWFAREAL